VNSIYHHDLAYIHAAAFEFIAKGASPEILSRLQNCTTKVRKVLEVGCGAGTLTKALLEARFNVTSADSSAEMLELAKANVLKATFLHASAYEIDVRGYDAVVAVGEPLTYHAEHVDADHLLSSFFQRVARAIPSGGMLIFDVIGLGEPSVAGRSLEVRRRLGAAS
jgi:cyclopropane fatty-acyl-phospholipid synthase-like methyltransferase